MDRSAPAQGYDDSEKELYRRRVWNIFRHHVRGKPVLLMPSAEALELNVAIEKGMEQRLLHVVDKNAAIIAHVKRRFPHVNTYGVDIVEACTRIGRKGIRLHAANFDLCGPVGLQVFDDLHQINHARCLASNALVAVTVLRGRERPYVSAWLDEEAKCLRICVEGNMPNHERSLCERDHARISLLLTAIGAVRSVAAGVYMSSNRVHTMLWTVLQMPGCSRMDIELADTITETTSALREYLLTKQRVYETELNLARSLVRARYGIDPSRASLERIVAIWRRGLKGEVDITGVPVAPSRG